MLNYCKSLVVLTVNLGGHSLLGLHKFIFFREIKLFFPLFTGKKQYFFKMSSILRSISTGLKSGLVNNTGKLLEIVEIITSYSLVCKF